MFSIKVLKLNKFIIDNGFRLYINKQLFHVKYLFKKVKLVKDTSLKQKFKVTHKKKANFTSRKLILNLGSAILILKPKKNKFIVVIIINKPQLHRNLY